MKTRFEGRTRHTATRVPSDAVVAGRHAMACGPPCEATAGLGGSGEEVECEVRSSGGADGEGASACGSSTPIPEGHERVQKSKAGDADEGDPLLSSLFTSS